MPEPLFTTERPRHSEVLTWPNLVSTFRIMLVPVFVHYILIGRFDWALGVFAVAGLSDGLDGWLARRLNQRTTLGQMLDPIGDKLLMLCGFLVLSVPGSNFEPIPTWLTVCVIGRDAGIVIAAALIYRRTGFRDFKPSLPGKISTAVQVCFVVFFLTAQVWTPARHVLFAAVLLTAGTTLGSAVHYAFFVRAELRAYARRRPVVFAPAASPKPTAFPEFDSEERSKPSQTATNP